MKFGEVVACVAVLGYTSAIKIEEPEPPLESFGPGQYMLDHVIRDTINHIDADNEVGLKGAVQMCDERNDWE